LILKGKVDIWGDLISSNFLGFTRSSRSFCTNFIFSKYFDLRYIKKLESKRFITKLNW